MGWSFGPTLCATHEWTAHLTEDIEFHMSLIASGERVMFAPDAVVRAEMPESLEASATQNERWERGRVEMLRQYVPQLLKEAGRRLAKVIFVVRTSALMPPWNTSSRHSPCCSVYPSLSFWRH